MKHLLLIVIPVLLLSSPVNGNSHKAETLYLWGTSYFNSEWKEIGDKKKHPVYKGEVENGVPNGDKYVGGWKEGNRNGKGTFTFSNGSKYVGEYKDGLPNGQGSYTFGKGEWDGHKYVGEYKDGIPDGLGSYTYSSGDKYVGKWKNGKRNGQGIFTFADGDHYKGEFKDGKVWKGKVYNGNFKYKIVDGK